MSLNHHCPNPTTKFLVCDEDRDGGLGIMICLRSTHVIKTHVIKTHASKTHAIKTHAIETHAIETHAIETHASKVMKVGNGGIGQETLGRDVIEAVEVIGQVEASG
jgi:hypothetical protein